MKISFKRAILNTLLKFPYIKHCSQTVYESLLGCCRMWEFSKSQLWKKRAENCLAILIKIQKKDGGFDIGYDFNFGLLHKKGLPTSPELVGLIALCEFSKLFGAEKTYLSAKKAAEWIRNNIVILNKDMMAIPYSPYTTKNIMIYNGTSFACGALGCYIGVFGGDSDLVKYYNGMINYLYMNMSNEQSGSFWYYYDQKRTDLNTTQKSKIDYYHQMQQVEVHSIAQQMYGNDLQLQIIKNASDFIISKYSQDDILPYTNNPFFFKNQIHIWGLASAISGFLEAAKILPSQKDRYAKVATEILNWIIKHAWNGEYFEAILNRNGTTIDSFPYMVRSDAWVFNAIATYARFFGDGPWVDIADRCYQKMESVDFSGVESHASCFRRRFLFKLINACKFFIKK